MDCMDKSLLTLIIMGSLIIIVVLMFELIK